MHNLEKYEYDQSISAGRLGETVMWRLVSIKRNVKWPGLVNRSQEDLSAVGCRLSSHTIQNKGSWCHMALMAFGTVIVTAVN